MSYKRILTIQDISCVGQCSLAVAVPILAACGNEAVMLPTAVLSTHTGGFKSPNFRDLSEDIPKISAHWEREGIYFDAAYTGYLGSIPMIDMVRDVIRRNGGPGCVKIVDPAMGDYGKLYSGFGEDYALAMRRLVAEADVALPNITEAAMMTDSEYREEYDEDYIKTLMAKMLDLGTKSVVLTGVSFDPAHTGAAVMDAEGRCSYHAHARFEKGMHGTGDIFAAAFTGMYVKGRSMEDSARIAADFACRCIELSLGDPSHAYGTKFGLALPDLIRMAEA